MTTRIVDHPTARRAALIATVWVPLAILGASEAAIVAIGATSRSPLVVHWGGGPDSYGPWWTYTILVAAVGLSIVVLMGAFIARASRLAGMIAWLPAIALGMSVFIGLGTGVGSVALNSSPLAPAVPILAGAVLAVATVLITYRLLPREAPASPEVVSADRLPVAPGEVAAWTGKVDLPAWFLVVVATLAALLLALGVVLLLVVGGRVWPLFIAPTVVLVALLITGQFIVTAGPRGFTARSLIGWPRFTVPAADIQKAGVVEIDPVADFGGWGIRWVTGGSRSSRWGIVTRRGASLEVVRRDGRSIVVTVDDAGTAAAVLETYAATPR